MEESDPFEKDEFRHGIEMAREDGWGISPDNTSASGYLHTCPHCRPSRLDVARSMFGMEMD